MFVSIYWSYGKWFVLIVRSTVSLIDHLVVNIWILALTYKSIPSFVEIFFRLKKSTYARIIYIYIYTHTPHTPRQKYKTTLKNEEKDIVYNF